MNWYHREPTLDEIFSDSIVRAGMEADGIDPQQLAATLRQAGRTLVRRARVVPDVDKRPGPGGGHGKPDRPAIIFGMVAKLFAKATTKFELATTIAALWLTVVPITGAVANGQISAARAAAIHECSLLAARYPQHEWGNTEIYLYRSCMARHGQQE